MSFNELDRAQILAEALPYIQRFTGKTIVVKYDSGAVTGQVRDDLLSDVILLSLVGIRVVVVHGGGPEINELLEKTGKESRFVNGLRYTDEETMAVVQQVLCGQVNKDLVAVLNRLGGRAVGLCGLDGALFQAKMRDEKYGLVGDIAKVDAAMVAAALNSGYIPVVAPVAQGVDSQASYNLNSDTAAARLAVALEAEKLVLLTGVRGLFRTALQLTVAHLPTTVILVLLTFQAAIFCLNRWWPVVFLPSVGMLLASLFTERVFRKYAPELAPEPDAEPEE